MKGEGGNNRSYEVWAASLLLGELMSDMKIKPLARQPCIMMLFLVFLLAGSQQVLENGMQGGMGFAIDNNWPNTRHLISSLKGSRLSRQGKYSSCGCVPRGGYSVV